MVMGGLTLTDKTIYKVELATEPDSNNIWTGSIYSTSVAFHNLNDWELEYEIYAHSEVEMKQDIYDTLRSFIF